MNYVVRLYALSSEQLPDGTVLRTMHGDEYGLTGSSFICGEMAPGFGPPLHRHPVEEIFLTLEGQVIFTIGELCLRVGPGNLVIVPAGVPHRFVNAGEGPLIMHAFLAGARIVTDYVESSDSLAVLGR